MKVPYSDSVYTPVPDGVYVIRFDSYVGPMEGEFEDRTGGPSKYITGRFSFPENPDLAEAMCTVNFSVNRLTPKTKLYSLLTALGLAPQDLSEGVEVDIDAFLGRLCMGVIKQEPGGKMDGQGKPLLYSNIQDFLPYRPPLLKPVTRSTVQAGSTPSTVARSVTGPGVVTRQSPPAGGEKEPPSQPLSVGSKTTVPTTRPPVGPRTLTPTPPPDQEDLKFGEEA